MKVVTEDILHRYGNPYGQESLDPGDVTCYSERQSCGGELLGEGMLDWLGVFGGLSQIENVSQRSSTRKRHGGCQVQHQDGFQAMFIAISFL